MCFQQQLSASVFMFVSGSKVKRRVVLQKMHPTTSSHSVLMELLKPSLFTAGTTSHHWPSTELSLPKRRRRSGAGEAGKEWE